MKRVERYQVQNALDWAVRSGNGLRDELVDAATLIGGRAESVTCDGVDFIVTVVEDENDQ